MLVAPAYCHQPIPLNAMKEGAYEVDPLNEDAAQAALHKCLNAKAIMLRGDPAQPQDESVFSTYAVPYPPPDSLVDQPLTPPSSTLTASTTSVAGTPKKRKKPKKKKKKSATTNEVQAALTGMSLNEAEEDEFSM
ncbi:hypothetical protein C8R44DRAFT_755414 [Mycena epipterygia]|nr:hypothetical protein C8R44DRAFT_755414 [Mycena epipterygia]